MMTKSSSNNASLLGQVLGAPWSPFSLSTSAPLRRTYANDGKHLPSSHLASVACVLLLLSLLMSKQIMPPLTHGPGCCLNERERDRERERENTLDALCFVFSLSLSFSIKLCPGCFDFYAKINQIIFEISSPLLVRIRN